MASKIKLAILDDYRSIATPIFSRLASRVDVTCFPDTLNPTDASQKALLVDRLHPFTAISTMRERTTLTADVIAALPNLKIILTTGPFNAGIDVSACNERGIVVAGTIGATRVDHGPASRKPVGPFDPTTEHIWALILGFAKNIARDDAAVKGGGWQMGLSVGLSGKTLGLLGLGRLGMATARIAVLAFHMKIIAWSSNLEQQSVDAELREAGLPAACVSVARSKMELFKEADVVSVHYVLSERSKAIVGAQELAAMKETAYLVNTSRGPLVDEAALLDVLKRGKIRGAALDVFDTEPLPPDSEWRTTKWGQDGRSEVVLTPHMGYVEESTIHVWYEENANDLEAWLDGKPVKLPLSK